MKKIKKYIIYMLNLSLLLLSLSACSTEKVTVNVKPEKFEALNSGTITENQKYILDWDDTQKCILLKNKETSHIWSTLPYSFFLQNDTNINLSSPIFINYYNPNDGSLMTAKAFADCIESGNLSVTEDNGTIRMEFYFDDAEILVPLVISLNDNCLQATVRADEIKESGKTQLIDISVLPYFCSTVNSADRSSYLFVPVGSGALMYTDEDVQEFSRSYSGEVYGEDAARYLLDDTANEEPIRLPIFGVKANDNAMFAIIENGAESAIINADAGNSRNGYSTAYATFTVRGHDETEVKRTDYSDALIYAAEINKKAVYSVYYYPLSGESADYNGMAALYKDYLTKKGSLIDSDAEQSAYQLKFLGGSLVNDVILGVPNTRMQSATTFSEAQDIIKELYEETDAKPEVLLKGFAEDGLDIGRIAGGFGFSSVLGGKKGYLALNEYSEENGISLFAEYDLIHFNNSSDGFSTIFDTSQTAGKQLAAFFPLKKNIRYADENYSKVRLLQRSVLPNAIEKLVNKADYVSGISLTALGSIAYSDYSEQTYYAKGGTEKQVSNLLKVVKENGHRINIGKANGYAAGIADSISDVPLTNGGYFGLDESVPFYQMVFHGFSTLYSTSLNLSADWCGELLYALESGVSPSFTVTANESKALADTLSNEYYGSVYSGIKADIISAIKSTSDYFELVGDRNIVSHKILDSGAAVTQFSGGITVITNHSENDVEINGTKLQANSFSYTSGGVTKTCNLTGGGQ